MSGTSFVLGDELHELLGVEGGSDDMTHIGYPQDLASRDPVGDVVSKDGFHHDVVQSVN